MGVLEHVTFYTVVGWSLLCMSTATEEWLIYASVHDSTTKTNGLYSGLLDIDYNGTVSNLSQTGVYCANMESAGFYKGYMISSMGYDPVSEKAVVQMQTHSHNFRRASMFTTKACKQGPPRCTNAEIKVIFAQAETKQHNGNVGPFAMWNSSIYFIAHMYERGAARTIHHRIEIRRLDGCEDRMPFTMTNAFDIEACSMYITLVAHETGEDLGFEMEDTLLVARQLYITKAAGQLLFLIQMQNQTYNDNYDVEKFSMQLYVASETAPTKVLYEEILPDRYAEHEISHLGGIDYREGVLCWTMLVQVFCANWDGQGPLDNVRTAVSSGAAAQVCSVEGPKFLNMGYSNITTGVTIASVEEGDVVIIFGCFANEGHQGGAGVVTLTSAGKTSKILPLMDGNGKIYAGTILLGCKENSLSSIFANVFLVISVSVIRCII